VPTTFKSAHITPLIKKPDIDPAEPKSYRPISNLTVLSKTLERLVARQLLDYPITADLLPDVQSAYRAHHSTETAVLKVLGDILRAVSGQWRSCCSGTLDLSAEFDTVDHVTLLQRLRISYSLGGRVHDWFQSYLSGRLSVCFSVTFRRFVQTNKHTILRFLASDIGNHSTLCLKESSATFLAVTRESIV